MLKANKTGITLSVLKITFIKKHIKENSIYDSLKLAVCEVLNRMTLLNINEPFNTKLKS